MYVRTVSCLWVSCFAFIEFHQALIFFQHTIKTMVCSPYFRWPSELFLHALWLVNIAGTWWWWWWWWWWWKSSFCAAALHSDAMISMLWFSRSPAIFTTDACLWLSHLASDPQTQSARSFKRWSMQNWFAYIKHVRLQRKIPKHIGWLFHAAKKRTRHNTRKPCKANSAWHLNYSAWNRLNQEHQEHCSNFADIGPHPGASAKHEHDSPIVSWLKDQIDCNNTITLIRLEGNLENH